MPKAESAFSRATRDLRHDHRLALRQPADEGAVRRRLDARDGRERRRRLQDRAATTRTALALARSQQRALAAQASGCFDGGDRAGDASRRRRATRSSSTRTSIRARPASRRSPSCKGVVRPDGTRDRRQRLGRQRRRLRAAARRAKRAAQRHGLTPRARVVGMADGRRGAAHHGHRPGAGDAQGARARRPDARRRST